MMYEMYLIHVYRHWKHLENDCEFCFPRDVVGEQPWDVVNEVEWRPEVDQQWRRPYYRKRGRPRA